MRALTRLLTEIRLTFVFVAVVLFFGWLFTRQSFAFRNSRQSVEALANRLDAQVERGRYRRVDSATVSENDAWGNRLVIEYREEGVGERLIVSSAGRDGSLGTDDDIIARRWLLNAKGIGEEIRDGSAAVAQEASKGAIRGIKEELKATFKRTAKE